ncbi:MAG: MFS transporter [Caulobacteraceae bacterium]
MSAAAGLKPSVPVKLAYGLGQAAQSGGFDTAIGFVFFYYTAVLGLSGALVGVALAIGLAFDAAVDPLIGSLSDNTRSRLGRRLPLMIIAIPLIALSMGLLFAPPEHGSTWLVFGWLTVASVAVRAFISLFNVPYIALGAEMADGYVERSSVVAYRAIIGIFSAVGVTALAFTVFFVGKSGLQNAQAYPGFGWTVAAVLVVAMAFCCLGIRRYAVALPRPEHDATPMARRLPGEIIEIFRNRSFRILFASSVIFYVAVGLNATLNSHAYVFVWRLKAQTIQFVGYAYLMGILAGVPIAPLLQRVMEKKAVVLIGVAMVVLTWLALPGLRASGLIHPTGGAALPLLALSAAFGGVGIGFVVIAYPSMMADAADEHEMLFRRRREGLYFSGLGFAAKAASGLGVLVAGFALNLIGFPTHLDAQPGSMLAEGTLAKLMLAWGPAAALLGMVSLAIFLPYGITRRRHDEISAELKQRRMATAA